MEFIRLYAATSNSDTTEGRGSTIVQGHFRDIQIAKAVVEDKRYSRYCTMGIQTKDDVKYMVREENIKIYASVEDFFSNTVEERRKRAIAKLSDEDCEVLGLKK